MTEVSKVRALFFASLILTAAIAAWMHAIRVDVAAYDKIRIFLSLFLFQDYWTAFAMIVVLVSALNPWVQDVGLEAVRFAGQRPITLFLLTTLTLALGTRYVYHAHPLAMDEYAAVFQSSVFAAGRVFGQLPPDLMDWLVPKGFQGHFLRVSHETGQIASMYWPGFALILTPFTLLGAPWAANPLLGGLAVLLVHRLALRLTDSTEAAGLAALLTVASPAVTVNAISLYSMPAHLVCNASFVLLLMQPSFSRSVLAGCIGSLALVLHNPLPHILVAAPWLIWLCARSDRLRTIPGIAIGYLPLCLILGFGWLQLLAQIPTGVITPTASEPGFVAASIQRLGSVSVFSMPHLDLLEDRLMAVAKLWLWAVPGLLLLSIFGARVARADVRCRLLAWSAVLTLLGFLFVPADQGHGWGFRYFHAAWFVLPILAVFAVPPGWIRSGTSNLASTPSPLAGYVAACAVLSLTVMTGVQAFQVERFIARQLMQIPAVTSGVPQVVFVRWQQGYYAADLVQNDPFLRNQPLILLSQGDRADSCLISARFPGLQLLASSATGNVWGERRP